MPEFSFQNQQLKIDSDHIIDPLKPLQQRAFSAEHFERLVQEAFESPINFPPIPEAILADDQVVVVVGENVPSGIHIAASIAKDLVSNGHLPTNLTILLSQKPNQADQAGGVGSKSSELECTIEIHDPSDEQNLAYLLVDQQGSPYHINRRLFDADVVIPVGCCDGQPPQDPISPAFCNKDTQKILNKMEPDELAAAKRLIAHNLGIFWQVQVVNGPQGLVDQLLVGESHEVITKAMAAGENAWSVSDEHSSDMALVSIDVPECQNWQDIRKAILAADPLVQGDGPIVVCCDVGRKPPAWWAVGEDGQADKDQQLNEVFGSRHVYLFSRLSQEVSEQVGFGFLDNSDQLQKLVDTFSSVVLLRDGQKIRMVEASSTIS